MKLIPLTQNKFTMVDDSDYDELSKYKWQVLNTPYGIAARRGCSCPFGGFYTILMHRQIMSCPSDMLVDHKNHDMSDNRKENLRVCTRAQNNQNRVVHKNSKSQIKGLHLRDNGKWRTRIRFNRKLINIGTFDTKEQAIMEYNKKANELFGDFAYNNRIDDIMAGEK